MSRIQFEFHSPLTLLRHWQQRSDTARLLEVLVIGYTLDLAFIEQRAVSLARGMGARVTILSDADQAVHDAVDVYHAGRSYQHAHVGCRGAFHPKLVVLIGEQDVWVMIGSGNPTTAGWGHNDELWLVIRSERARGPRALLQLGGWLTALTHHSAIWMPSWIAASLVHIADMVTPAVVDESVPELRIVGNLDEPLLHQLPSEPVSSLRLSAPFFDPAGSAVKSLIDRMDPEEVTIGLQPSLSSYHGKALADAANTAKRSAFCYISEDGNRISHGKLVEWDDEHTVTAMVGSPNLSRAALLTATRDGGNCELAAIYRIATSLLPEGISAESHDVGRRSTLPADAAPRAPAPVTMLGARRSETGVTVELKAARPATITIEMSYTAAPGEWQPYHRLDITESDTASVIRAEFLAPESAGAAVRAIAQHDLGTTTSSVVFLTDTAKCQARTGQSSSPRLTRDYTNVFEDADLLARFERDLLNLMRANASHRMSIQSAPAIPKAMAIDDNDRWGAWLNDLETTVGPSLTAGLFPVTTSAIPSSSGTVWAVDADDAAAAGNADDDQEDDSDESALGEVLSNRREPPDIPAEHRRRLRLWADRLRRAVTAATPPTVELRMLVTQLHLDLLAAGVWGHDDDWFIGFADVVRAMPPGEYDALPDRAESYVGSLAAVGLALLSQDATLHGGRSNDIMLQRVWDNIGQWAAHADADLIDHYLYQPAQTYSRVADREEVEAVIRLARAAVDDPDARLRAALESDGIAADYIDSAWVVAVADATPAAVRRLAARTGTLIGQHADTYAVLVRSDRSSCVLLCHQSTMAIAESGTRIWRAFTKRTPVSTPTTMLTEGLPSGTTYPRKPGASVPDEVTALAEAAGVNIARLLVELR